MLSPTSLLILVPSIILTPNTAGNNADIFIYIYGLSGSVVLLIIIIIIIIISVIYIIKCHTKSEHNIYCIIIVTTMYTLFIYTISLVSQPNLLQKKGIKYLLS